MVVDYGYGNIPSVVAGLQEIGLHPSVDTQGDLINQADIVFLPGVASFGPAKRRLEQSGQADSLRQAHSDGRWIVGLCLGAQLLMEASQEATGDSGFAFVSGQVTRMDSALMTVPNQGWHQLHSSRQRDSFPKQVAIAAEPYVYFSHSYQIKLNDENLETSHIKVHGERVTASYEDGNIRGFQFHPELSGEAGLYHLKQAVKGLK